jgi:pyrimidine-nucleoside phosphorylase
MTASLVELIAKKRDGHTLAADDITRLITAFSNGELADYQMAALLMAIYFRGLDVAETTALTFAMLHSGSVLDLSGIKRFKVDKHSTGGVGDKVSICLAPLVAACDVAVPMVSGRGLGHTGGTLDKLEAIRGFRTDLPVRVFTKIVEEVGVCMIGQTKEIAPADRRMYALRDVTATVESIPLIVASILSKKLAEGIDGLVLDVKVGRGAFMKTEPEARALAQALVDTGTHAGKKVVAILTDMSAPLGVAVGNANETREAIAILHGEGPDDVRECTLALASEMLLIAGRVTERAAAKDLLHAAIANGAARRVMQDMVAAQGGDVRVVAEPDRIAVAPSFPIVAEQEGVVTGVDPLEIGLAAVALGAGRTRADQAVDPSVGVMVHAKPGARVTPGTLLAEVQAKDAEHAAAAKGRVRGAFQIGREGEGTVSPAPLIRGRIEAGTR